MANEITINNKIAVAKGSLSLSRGASGATLTMSGTNYVSRTVSVPTTAAGTALNFGSVATNGWAYFQNVDATNFIQIGVQVAGTFYPVLRLNVGEPGQVIRLAQGVTYYAVADTLAATLDYAVIDN